MSSSVNDPSPRREGPTALPPTAATLRALESEFADAMTRMYAVGNGLARVRAQVDAAESAASAHSVGAVDVNAAGTSAHRPTPAAQTPAAQTPADGSLGTSLPAGAPVPATPVPATPVLATADASWQGSPAVGTPGGPAAGRARPSHPGLVQPPPVPPRGSVPPPPPQATAPASNRPWWRQSAIAALLAVAGAGITLIGVAFLVALAIQLGIFGPVPRVVAGALLAAGLVGAGMLVAHRQRSTAGALGLVATGLAAGYLDVIAVTAVYDWVPAPVGLVVAAAIAGVGLGLTRRWGHQLLGVITVLGAALLAPFVGHESGLLTAAFLVVLTLATWPAQLGRQWPWLETARVVPASLIITVIALADGRTTAVGALSVVFAATVTVTSVIGTRSQRLPSQVGIFAAVASMPVAAAAIVADQWPGGLLLVALTALHVGAAALSHSSVALEHRLREISLTVAGGAGLLAVIRLLDGSAWTAAALAAVGLVWALAALVFRGGAVAVTAGWIAALLALGSSVLLPSMISARIAADLRLVDLVFLALLVAIMVTLAVVAARIPAIASTLVPTTGAVALVALGGAVITGLTLVGRQAGAAETGFLAGHAAATVLWLVVAAALLVIGSRRSNGLAAAGALVLTAACIAKLVLFDLASLDGLARVAGFILGGVILLAMGAYYAQGMDRDGDADGVPPVDPGPRPATGGWTPAQPPVVQPQPGLTHHGQPHAGQPHPGQPAGFPPQSANAPAPPVENSAALAPGPPTV